MAGKLVHDSTVIFWDEADAQAVADANQADDEDWKYVVEQHGRGFEVAIYDEDGVRLGVL